MKFSNWLNVSEDGEPFPVLDFNGQVKKNKNGSIQFKKPYKKADYQGLEFRVYHDAKLEIRGSLHKYFNKGLHNFNDFSKKDLNVVLNDLKNRFHLNLSLLNISCIEFGVNIKPPIPTNDILKNSFLHIRKPFEWVKNSDEGKYIQVEHQQYYLKIYNKALHYKKKGYLINQEIMRLELKTKRLFKIKHLNTSTLADLFDLNMEQVKNLLIKEWVKVLYFDNTLNLNSTCLSRYSNPNWWIDAIENKSTGYYNYHRKTLVKSMRQSSQNTQRIISEIINRKFNEMNIN